MPDDNIFDKDKMGNQAIMNFQSRRGKLKNDSETTELQEQLDDTSTPVIEKKSSTKFTPEEMREKVNTARFYGTKEIKQFREIIRNAVDEINKLTLFEGVGEVVNFIAIDEMLNFVIDPIFKGDKPYDMPDDFFKAIRQDIYKKLIKRYAMDDSESK